MLEESSVSLEGPIVCGSFSCSSIGKNNEWTTFANLTEERSNSAYIVINDKVVDIKIAIELCHFCCKVYLVNSGSLLFAKLLAL